jgi:hypothetical protein
MKTSMLLFTSFLIVLLLPGCSNSLEPIDDGAPVMIVSFSIIEDGHVRLWVENAYGTHIATLINDHLAAGSYAVSLSRIDENGNRLARGLYTLHLVTAIYTEKHSFLISN